MAAKFIGESPLQHLVSFNKWLTHYDEKAKSDDPLQAKYARRVLKAVEPYPELREGFSDLSLLEKHKGVIRLILNEAFSPVLTQNEIKTAAVAFDDITFNSTQRFEKILGEAGPEFQLQIQNMPEGMHYIIQSVVILNFYYGFSIDFKRPMFYSIPNADGVMKHYRILYNADFMEVIPTKKAKKLGKKDLDELLENFEDLELWKKKIPPNSFIGKGFVISNMFDVTAEHSISEIKSTLIGGKKRDNEDFMDGFQETFRSLFNLPNIQVGFTGYEEESNRFFRIYGKGMDSYILNGKEKQYCDDMLCEYSADKILGDMSYYAISNLKKSYEKSEKLEPYKSLYEQGFKSAILAPIADGGKLLGVLEIVSTKTNELNSINAIKLDDVMPFIVSAVLRSIEEEENRIDAIIQHECTTVHDSVFWRFKEEAKRFMEQQQQGNNPVFEEISFKDVYPLYGQIDIKDSSKQRNIAVQRDLVIQLSEIKTILSFAIKTLQLPIYEELQFRVGSYLEEISENLLTNSEQAIADFVKEEINPVFEHLMGQDAALTQAIETYHSHIDESTESYYDHRRNYDQSVTRINRKLASLLDKKQEEAQQMFPHYYERYKTDGVEHNLYIGSSISQSKKFDPIYLSNLRLWQLQVMVEMENAHYALKPDLPVKLDVASLMLVYSTSLAIRFRMDEKRFDVDGTYNARYEIIKKRIDKALIKGTRERLTQKGKLSIVYSQKKDEREYLRYIHFLKAKGYFTDKIEILELQGLQGVSGLKAIRAEILYKKDKGEEQTYTYADLMQELELD